MSSRKTGFNNLRAFSMDILKVAVETAKKNGISTVVVASTTGKTASALFELAKIEKLRMITVTHDEGRPPKGEALTA